MIGLGKVDAVHADDLQKAIHDAVAPLLAELIRIRELLEAHAATATPSPAARPPTPPTQEDAAPAAPPAAAHIAALLPAPEIVAAPAATLAEVPPALPPSVDPVAIFRQLLDEYPDDAAAVYFAFHRQHRCAPDYLDRLSRRCGLEEAWSAVNRITVRALVERQHGGLASVAELLGRDSDSLSALIDRIGLRAHVEAVRARERLRAQSGSLAYRVGQLLYRDRLLQDLGLRAAMETNARQEMLDRCASLAGECDDGAAVLEQLGRECQLDASGLERLLRRFDLQRFVADLYREPAAPEERRVLRRGPRPEAGRRSLDDREIETRILRMLLAKRKVGAAHTHIDHLVRTVPTHERGRARAIVDQLVAEGMLVLKVTDNSAEPHVSLAVAAVPRVEQRVRSVLSEGAPAQG